MKSKNSNSEELLRKKEIKPEPERAVRAFLAGVDRADRRNGFLRGVGEREIGEATISWIMLLLVLDYAERVGAFRVWEGRSFCEVLRESPLASGIHRRLEEVVTRVWEEAGVRLIGGDSVLSSSRGELENGIWLEVFGYLFPDGVQAMDLGEIGHAYEVLLGFRVVREGATRVGVIANAGVEISLGLEELEAFEKAGCLVDKLADLSRKSGASVKRALARGRKICFDGMGVDEVLAGRIQRYGGIIRDDDWGNPVIAIEGRMYWDRGLLRKSSGAHYTPREVTEQVVEGALRGLVYSEGRVRAPREILGLRICDIAMGAGAFLQAACRYLATSLCLSVDAWGVSGELFGCRGVEGENFARYLVARECLFGVDRNATAVEMGRLSLWLLSGARGQSYEFLSRNLRNGDALLGPSVANLAEAGLGGLDFRACFGEVFARDAGGFDCIIGNPPWVAYAGRSAQPLERDLREYYAKRYRAFRGFRTLHGIFVERACELAPRGIVALILPSPVADLETYGAVREQLSRTHCPREPLLEFGQDAFRSVTQPCFALIAEARAGEASERAWKLSERKRYLDEASEVDIPEVIRVLREASPMPEGVFGERGFQSTRGVIADFGIKSKVAIGEYTYPLMEGSDVGEFSERLPQLFLRPDREALRRRMCRLREEKEYQKVGFVIRQTASWLIAAVHCGLPFRNSLLAGFEVPGMSSVFLVGLLNSALYRAVHLAGSRDVRQEVFPQVKIRQLRALPNPPEDGEGRARVAQIAQRMVESGEVAEHRKALDAAVFGLFGVPEDHRGEICRFLAIRQAKLGYEVAEGRGETSLDGMRRRLGGDPNVVNGLIQCEASDHRQ